MTSLHNSLAQLASGYSVFEKDQVLTEAHLNSVTDYLDDQDRLSRVQLTGVGIVCGLEVQLSGAQIRLGAGTGITSDGDLVQIAADISYDRFKAYDKQAPVYPPLYTDAETMLPAFELIATGTADPLARNLDQLPIASGTALAAMTALLLVESYIRDSDLCSGTDCDNRGQDYVSQTRLLLLPSAVVGPLMPSIPSATVAAAALPELVARRAIISAGLNSTAQVNSRFVSAANTMVADLNKAFAALWANAGFLLGDVFAGDPGGGWTTRLNNLSSSVGTNTPGAQYFYDLLKDLIATWNSMRAIMASEIPRCNPDTQAFPKHLLLGELNDASSHRFGFYRSAAIADSRPLRHAQFLARKIDTLLARFALPAAGPVRVTPSTSNADLERRAIPCYYQVDASQSIARFWNFDLSSRAMASYNYGYHGSAYGAQGAAASPLQSTIDSCDFFRIEGHVGSNVSTALAAIDNEIRSFNLPFAVTSVLLSSSRNGLVGKRGAGYSDLNRLHYLLRQDVRHALDEVSRFNTGFKTRVDQAVAAGTVIDDSTGSDGTTVTQLSNSRHAAINSKTQAVQSTMNLAYSAYRADSSWKTNIADTMTNAGEYKYQLGKVVKTEFVTPFDNLMGSLKVDWLDWLDVLIDRKDNDRDDKRLLREFIRLHPGMEHSGGVVRGGTFVLVYDSAGTVVADFMLSHYLHEEEDSVEEPPLPKPGIRPDWVIDNGIKLQPSFDHLFVQKLDSFKVNLDQEWTTKFDLQTSYTTAFQQSLGLVKDIYNAQVGISGVTQPPLYQDPTLGLLAENLTRDQAIIDDYRTKAENTALPEDTRTYYQNALDQKQLDLAKSTAEAAAYISANNISVSFGQDGYHALQEINNSIQAIEGNSAAITQATEQLTGVRTTTSNIGLAQGLETFIRRR